MKSPETRETNKTPEPLKQLFIKYIKASYDDLNSLVIELDNQNQKFTCKEAIRHVEDDDELGKKFLEKYFILCMSKLFELNRNEYFNTGEKIKNTETYVLLIPTTTNEYPRRLKWIADNVYLFDMLKACKDLGKSYIMKYLGSPLHGQINQCESDHSILFQKYISELKENLIEKLNNTEDRDKKTHFVDDITLSPNEAIPHIKDETTIGLQILAQYASTVKYERPTDIAPPAEKIEKPNIWDKIKRILHIN